MSSVNSPDISDQESAIEAMFGKEHLEHSRSIGIVQLFVAATERQGVINANEAHELKEAALTNTAEARRQLEQLLVERVQA